MREKTKKDITRLIGVVGISGIMIILAALKDKYDVRETPNIKYKESRKIIDSAYTAKKDSLRNWYHVQIDSLKRNYQIKRDLGNLIK